MGVPLLVLLGAGLTRATNLPTDDRLGYVVPGVLALTVMSTAFTGQAITTGYERSYGVLKRLGASPLTRPGLLFAKTTAIGVLVALQLLVLAVVGVAGHFVLPLAAHAEALRNTLTAGTAVPAGVWLSLTLWAGVSLTAAARAFRWE
jgi:ABC-2 type transport system permease protein